ncbi:hypothetical protein HanIR_Chr07g0312381 [Helianthus annuus]|nr:hypothetical protein HanIR_Chr07g0312381 [Helianthus annuus]
MCCVWRQKGTPIREECDRVVNCKCLCMPVMRRRVANTSGAKAIRPQMAEVGGPL